MSQKAKDGNILSFFKSVPQTQSRTRSSTTADVKASSPSSSLPSTPARPSRRPRASEIADSDSEGSPSSDDSLDALDALLNIRPGKDAPVPPPRAGPGNAETPRAKRTALNGFHSSPLAIIPKRNKHMFDFDALTNDARLDEEFHQSSIRAQKLAEELAKARPAKTAPTNSQDDDDEEEALMDLVAARAGDDAQKVLRAVKTANPGNSQWRYCFFDRQPRPSETSSMPLDINGPWRILTQGDIAVREQHLVSGLPYTLLRKVGQLDDGLFIWMLEEICVQRSPIIRLEYSNLVQESPVQIERLVDAGMLDRLFLRLGASDDLLSRDAHLPIHRLDEDPYENRDWSNLRTFLSLLAKMAPFIPVPGVSHAVRILLRLSLDNAVARHVDILPGLEQAIASLLECIPSPSWDLFCFDTTAELHTLVKSSSIRVNAPLCLPISTSKARDLRRRLALSSLFDDSELARRSPSDHATLRNFIDRLGEKDFSITTTTSFLELQSNIMLLDMAIDDGFYTPSDDKQEEKAYNADVDELTDALRGIWRNINDTGLKLARTDTKGVIEWVQHRLAHSLRTRRKAKKSIFDVGRHLTDVDPFMPKQQDYMKKFLNKTTPAGE